MVNILLSTYNGEDYIKQQLDSIIEQTYTDYKLYIRDDGSSDNTVRIIEQIVREKNLSEKIIVIKGKNLGFCRSFGELLKYADEGELWAFCDQDDFWKPEKIEWAVEMLEMQQSIPVLYTGNFAYVNSNLEFIKNYNPNYKGYDLRKSITSSICYGFTCVINRKLREMLLESDFSKIQSHDWYMAMIASTFGKIIFDSRIVALHILHATNDSPINIQKKVIRGISLLKKESFYTMNCREFYHCYNKLLNEQQKKLMRKFLNYKYSLKNSLFKTFYPKRWNDSLFVEIVLRCLMLLGKI